MECPYTEHEMVMATNEAADKVSEEEITKIASFMNEFVTKNHMAYNRNNADFNKAVAEFHGISVVDLINSSNMEKLVDMYTVAIINKLIDDVEELNPNINSKVVWAMLFFNQKG